MTRNIASVGLEILFRSLGPRKTSLPAHVSQATAARRPTPSLNFSHPPITCSSRFPDYSKGTETRNTFSFFFSLLSNFSFLASFLRIIICIYTLILFVLFSSHPDKQGFFFSLLYFFFKEAVVHSSSSIIINIFALQHFIYTLPSLALENLLSSCEDTLTNRHNTHSFFLIICRITTTTRVIRFFFLE